MVCSAYVFHTLMCTWTHFQVFSKTTLLKYDVNIDLLYHSVVRVRILANTYLNQLCNKCSTNYEVYNFFLQYDKSTKFANVNKVQSKPTRNKS